MNLRMRERCFQGLVEICGEYGILPNSYITAESKVQKLGDCPISSDGLFEVWPGSYGNGTSVTVKSTQYRKSANVREIKKVGYVGRSPHHNRA